MNKQSFRDLCDCKKNNKVNINVIEVGEREEKEGWVEKVLEEKIAENFPYLVEHGNLYIQESQWISSRIDSKRFTLKQIIIKL